MNIQFIKDGENLIILIPNATEEDFNKVSNLVKLLYNDQVKEKIVTNDIQKVTIPETKPDLSDATPFFLVGENEETEKEEVVPNIKEERITKLAEQEIKFGQKHYGETIKSIFENDPDWVEFVLKGNSNHPDVALIKEYYALIHE